MDILFTLFSFLGCSAVWLLPTALAAAALVDMVRVRAEWYWCFIIFGIPVFGPLAYFAVSYLPILGGSQAISTFSPTAHRRTQARRRLREIEIQLQHWRGPALLAEAGTQCLALGKLKQAEEFLREAKAADADVKDVNFDFAQVLQVRGRRWSEALPLLQELVDLEPDARFGAARLALARCLDECGDKQRAEEELRAVLKKRNPPEGKVRLARILLARGEGREATELLAEVRADAATLPKYLYTEHKPWIRKAARLESPDAKLPPPKLEGVPPRRSPAFFVAVGLGVVLAVLILGFQIGRIAMPFFGSMSSVGDFQEMWQRSEKVTQRLKSTDRLHPAQVDASDPATVESALPGFVAVRRRLAEACTRALAARDEHRRASQEVLDADDLGTALGSTRHEVAWQRAQVELDESFATALESEDYGRGEFRRLAALVDGALLRRQEAIVLTLPEHFRADYVMALQTFDQPLPPRSEPGWRRNVEAEKQQAQARLDSFRDMASVDIPEETRSLLEPRRPDLEASMPGGCIELLLDVLDPQLATQGYEDY